MDTSLHAELEFNKRRKLFIQDVPPVTHQDVRKFLGDIVPADIVISKRLYHVIITLKNSQEVDYALQMLQNRSLAGRKVEVELYPRRMMLYIWGIPLHYTDEMYRQFLSDYGEVETSFLSLTSKGDFKGYGFVEFAHNRATLKKVQNSINGSILEGHTLHCGLVSEHLLSYEHTLSKTLYCISESKSLQLSSTLLHLAQVFPLSEDRYLYVFECPDVRTAEMLWYESHQLPHSPAITGGLLFALPMTSAQQIAQIISTTPRRYPTLRSPGEVKHLLRSLFGHDEQTIQFMESHLYSNAKVNPSYWTLELTPKLLTKIFQSLTNGNRSSAMHSVLPYQQQTPHCDDLISKECERRRATQCRTVNSGYMSSTHSVGQMSDHVKFLSSSETHRTDSGDGYSGSRSCLSFQEKYPGPLTRQRKRSLEDVAITPLTFRKTPGAKIAKKERPVLFEADLNVALPQLFRRQCKRITTTPKVLKRLLPEPENSPGSPRLIGQHSQGIGGHYADSYQPSCKLNGIL
ncbi:RAVER2 [Bugula neritina]|uniref:RAVER2 n=1 Tax=Bugula neritina TaxID=10212 RepID=A0A7J7JR65_BUGNE|nr:RAVER2 [Bugula neritina]